MEKKILIIPSWYPTKEEPIRGHFFQEQAQLMAGPFDVKVLAGFQKDFSFYTCIKNILPFSSSLYRNNEIFLSPPEVYGFFFNKLPLRSNRLDIIWMMEIYRKKLEVIIKNGWRPDLIHSFSSVYGGIIADQLSREFKIPFLISEHNLLLFSQYSPFLRCRIIRALENATNIAVVSNYLKKMILIHNIHCDPIVVGNLIDDTKFFLEDEEKSSHTFNILYIAYPSHLKNIDTFYRAVKEMIRRGYKNISITIIIPNFAGGIRSEIILKYQKDEEFSRYCSFVGEIKRSELISYYHNADVLVSTSISETFGMSLCEAICCGIPVIVTNSGGVDDFVTSENGIKVIIGDYKGVADALVAIMLKRVNFNLRSSRKEIVGKYGKRAFYTRIKDLYEKTISKGNNEKNNF